MTKKIKNFIYKIINNDLINRKYQKIITRFPPEPNGYLHIGHVKSIYINFKIAKYFKGKCNLRFDDTNPSTEKKKYINSIKKDIKWLGFKWHKKEKYTSNYFHIYYIYAKKLIKNKLAYVDELSTSEIKKYRGTLTKPGIDSPYRNRDVNSNLLLFKKMKKGYFQEGQMCLRAKINMQSKNITLRDPVLYRIKYSKHPKTKKKWCIYPMYDFAHCIADSIEHVTHSICTLEFQNNKCLYNWILKNLNIQHRPKQYEFSKLNITYNISSKRKINQLIKKNIVTGWNDPRLMTLSGMRNKGYTSKSIINFCKSLGVSKQESIIDLNVLEKYLKKDLNIIAPRIMGIINPFKIICTNIKNNYLWNIKVSNHPINQKMGNRLIIFSREIYIEKKDFKKFFFSKKKKLIKNKIRLKYAGLIKPQKIIKNKNNKILYLECKFYKKNIYKKINIIHWLSTKNLLKTKIKFYYKLFNYPNPNIKKKYLSLINKKSLKIKYGYIEKSILKNKHKIFQFERIGYFKINKITHKKHIYLNQIISLTYKQ